MNPSFIPEILMQWQLENTDPFLNHENHQKFNLKTEKLYKIIRVTKKILFQI